MIFLELLELLDYQAYLGVSYNGGSPKWMVCHGTFLLKWMIWGTPILKNLHFLKKKHKVYKSGPVELYHPASKRGISWRKMKAAYLHKASVSCYGKLRMCPNRSSNTAIVDDRYIPPKQN